MKLRDEWPMVHIRRRGRIYVVVGYSFAELPRSLSPRARQSNPLALYYVGITQYELEG